MTKVKVKYDGTYPEGRVHAQVFTKGEIREVDLDFYDSYLATNPDFVQVSGFVKDERAKKKIVEE